MQIWSQGETTNNRKWYPTLDQPNERGTQEIILTVEDTMMTLSNGLLVSSTPLPGGMRRDDWKLDIPHAPYLAMIAVGKWDKVTDYWRGRPVEYYVDPGFGPSAKAIFANTPEMIEFFSTRLGFDFVWPKYAQIIVKDFVSGAMENSTAVVFGDFIEFNKEDMIEEGTNDYIVSHELFHHWFGDLVTCESWANITLNEGFANYAEYLWFEHKYGRERADISRISELSGYFDQTAHEVHPLIHYRYTDQEKMFDAHTYNKGGLVLHMLRDLVGDDAFFASLRTYLQQHAYESVEIDDLRQAFEEVTGKDLHWFFDQWYLGTGHPILDIRDTYDAASKKVNIEFIQTQDTAGYNSVFILPVDIAIYHQDSTVETQHIWLNQQTQTFSFDMADEPLAVVIDPRDILLAVVHQDIPESEYPLRAISNLSISHRISALRLMENIEPEVMEKLIADSSYSMRAMLVSYLVDKADADRLYEIAQTEKHADLQFYILQTLMPTDPLKARELALRMLQHTDKVPVIYAGLSAVAAVDVDQALQQLGHFLDNPAPAVFAAQAMIYAKKGNIVTLDFFTSEKAAQINEDYLEDFIGSMALFMSGQSAMIQDQGLSVIDSDFFLKTKEPQYRRFYLITGLLKQYAIEKDEVFQKKIINTIKSLYNKETDEYLRGVLKDGLGDLLN
jgi:aminopeptidase N